MEWQNRFPQKGFSFFDLFSVWDLSTTNLQVYHKDIRRLPTAAHYSDTFKLPFIWYLDFITEMLFPSPSVVDL